MEPIIEFENFTFKYRSQMEPTLRDINLKIYPGEKVLIIRTIGIREVDIIKLYQRTDPFFV